jgi:hypothetical protein
MQQLIRIERPESCLASIFRRLLIETWFLMRLIYRHMSAFRLPRKGLCAEGLWLTHEILIQNRKVAIANVVIRTRQYVAALIPLDDIIVMNTLRYADEIRSAESLRCRHVLSKRSALPRRKSIWAIGQSRA